MPDPVATASHHVAASVWHFTPHPAGQFGLAHSIGIQHEPHQYVGE
jgi:hypothetical protein